MAKILPYPARPGR